MMPLIFIKKPGERLEPLGPRGIRYVVARNGVFIERRTDMFETACRVDTHSMPLERHEEDCRLLSPRLPRELTERMLGFFRWAWDRHGGEAALVLLYSPARRKYAWACPPQAVEEWESASGYWYTDSRVEYSDIGEPPEGFVIYGDSHSHGDFSAYASSLDRSDETHKDGLHIVVGRVDRARPQFHIDFVMDGRRFPVAPEEFLGEGRFDSSGCFPGGWRQKVSVVRTPWSPPPRRDAARGGRLDRDDAARGGKLDRDDDERGGKLDRDDDERDGKASRDDDVRAPDVDSAWWQRGIACNGSRQSEGEGHGETTR